MFWDSGRKHGENMETQYRNMSFCPGFKPGTFFQTMMNIEPVTMSSQDNYNDLKVIYNH